MIKFGKKKPETTQAVANQRDAATDAPEKAAAPAKPRIVYRVDLYTYLLAAALFLLIISLIMLIIDVNKYKAEGVLPISRADSSHIIAFELPPV